MKNYFQLPQKIGLFQSWFEVYKVSKETFAICEPGHWEGVISYLIIGKNEAILFDTGMGIGNMKDVVDRLTRLNISVVNSHTHFDHVGCNHRFDYVAVFNNEAEIERLRKGVSVEELKGELSSKLLFRSLPNDFNYKGYRIRPSEPTRLLKNDESIDLGDRTLKVLHTPGHSPGSICLLDMNSKELFTGDTFYLSSLYAHLSESSLVDYYESADYLASMASLISVLRPSHDNGRRQPFAESDYLLRLLKAFKSIKNGETNFVRSRCPYTGIKILDYKFEGFSIWVKEEYSFV